MHELKKKAFFGMLWSGGNQVFSQIVLLIVKLILVKFLLPEEFGLAAIAYILVSSLSIINAFGTGTAFVQDRKSDPKKAKNTLFYLDAIAIVLISLLAFFAAPYAAQFFSNKIPSSETINTLVLMFKVIALIQLLDILVIVPGSVLPKELRFKEKIIAAGIGIVGYGIVASIAAQSGFGAWSIIFGQIANKIIFNSVLFAYSPFIPSFVFGLKIAKKYLKFGYNAFVNSIIGIVVRNGDDTLLGRLVGAAALGFYSLGQHFAGIVTTTVSGIVQRIMFPVLSSIQENKKLYVKAFFKSFKLINIFTIPAIGGAIILAEDIVLLIFGEKWLPILPVFYLLSIAALFNQMVAMAVPVLNSRGKPELIKRNQIIQFAFYVVLIYPFTKLWGLIGVCSVMIIFAIVALIHYSHVLTKEIPNFISSIFRILVRIIPFTLIMMLIVYAIKIRVSTNFFWLFSLVVIGVITYFIPILMTDQELRRDVNEALKAFRS